MPYPDGTPTAEEHAAKARRCLEPLPFEGEHLGHVETAVVEALRGIGHALLALVELEETRRAEGRGW